MRRLIFVMFLFAISSYAKNSIDELVNDNLNKTNDKVEFQEQKSRIQMMKHSRDVVPQPDAKKNPAESQGVIMPPDSSDSPDFQSQPNYTDLEDPEGAISREASSEKDDALERDIQKKALIKAIKEKAKKEGVEVKINDEWCAEKGTAYL